jgi:hypothetical protein
VEEVATTALWQKKGSRKDESDLDERKGSSERSEAGSFIQNNLVEIVRESKVKIAKLQELVQREVEQKELFQARVAVLEKTVSGHLPPPKSRTKNKETQTLGDEEKLPVPNEGNVKQLKATIADLKKKITELSFVDELRKELQARGIDSMKDLDLLLGSVSDLRAKVAAYEEKFEKIRKIIPRAT